MFRNLAIISALALGLGLTLTGTAQAQDFKKVVTKKTIGFKKAGFGITVNFGKYAGGYCGTTPYCPPNPCPPTYCPPVQGCYLVKYCNPCWHYKTFHCYQEACHFRSYKQSCGYETYIRCYGSCWRVYYRICHWQTYQVCHSYGQAQQIYHQLQGQGYSVKILPKH